MCQTFSFTVGEGVQKEATMRFWILAAIALMLAGDAIADTQRIGANNSTMRRISITDDNGFHRMELTVTPDFTPLQNGLQPLIYTANLIVNGKLPANTTNPWLDTCDSLCDLDRNLRTYVLSLEFCDDKNPVDVLVVQPQMNTFGQFDGSFSTKAYLADNAVGAESDAYPYLWGQRVVTEKLDIKLRRQEFSGDPLGFALEGTLPGDCP
jgi:hypothetical protein